MVHDDETTALPSVSHGPDRVRSDRATIEAAVAGRRGAHRRARPRIPWSRTAGALAWIAFAGVLLVMAWAGPGALVGPAGFTPGTGVFADVVAAARELDGAVWIALAATVVAGALWQARGAHAARLLLVVLGVAGVVLLALGGAWHALPAMLFAGVGVLFSFLTSAPRFGTA
ncbi:hypothetical protein [Pseudonocardia pini]|uniref:hypothetical protein n=1 Tax=Pseudonocardia pini TaxID=2758030 RepID=UPI0015F08E61|nr:hypothetical protein [Pseudonocardia pini]